MKKFFERIVSDLSAAGGAARDFVRARRDRPQSVALYGGFGAAGRALIFGRALADAGVPPAAAEHSRWQNALAVLRRADADPLPRARVRVTLGQASQEFVADDEGFFSGWMDCVSPPRLDADWVAVTAELADGVDHVRARGYVLVPAHAAERLIISDVDDTVLQSNVASLLLAARTALFENARTRLPFPGVAAFYRALRAGHAGSAGHHPLFYVSSSPWNLHDLLSEFLDIQQIPRGPLLLRDLDLSLRSLGGRGHHAHKRDMIRSILTTYPDAPAILIGDSSQQDPEIYRDVVHEFPRRIAAIYIRNVTSDPGRAAAIQELAAEVLHAGSSLVLADDTLAAARHAADAGFIARESLAAIGEEKRADEGRTSTKEDAPGARGPGDEPHPTVVIE